MHLKVHVLVFLLCIALEIAYSFGLWWAVGRVPFKTNIRHICRKARRLKGDRQFRMCQQEQKMVREIIIGAQEGIIECGHQLRLHRWNCTTRRKSLGKMLLKDTKETAFVQSITAAGVSHRITKACTEGKLLSCTCKHPRLHEAADSAQVAYWLKGCEDDVDFGNAKSREFMDTEGSRYMDTRSQILHHNNEVGRQALTKNIEYKCKCHGLSGSCAMKTCYRRMLPFRSTGKILTDKFEKG